MKNYEVTKTFLFELGKKTAEKNPGDVVSVTGIENSLYSVLIKEDNKGCMVNKDWLFKHLNIK